MEKIMHEIKMLEGMRLIIKESTLSDSAKEFGIQALDELLEKASLKGWEIIEKRIKGENSK